MIIFDVRDSQTGLHKSQPNVHDTAECPYVQARRVPVLQSMQTKFMQIPSSIKFCTLKPVGISRISILFQPHRIEAGPQHENFDSDGLQVAQFRYLEEGGLIILTPLTGLRDFCDGDWYRGFSRELLKGVFCDGRRGFFASVGQACCSRPPLR